MLSPLYVRLDGIDSSITIILMGKRELVALLNLSSWCLVMYERLFLAVLWGCLRFVIVVFPDHTHLLFLMVLIPVLCSLLLFFIFVYRKPAINVDKVNKSCMLDGTESSWSKCNLFYLGPSILFIESEVLSTCL